MGEHGLRVLVVDDDEAQLDLVARILRRHGFEVTTSSSSLGVSNLARRFSPDVVLLDVNIPALSGDRLAPLLRQIESEHPMRVVLFSACDVDRLRSLATSVSADAWIQKGCDGEELANRLRQICGRRAT